MRNAAAAAFLVPAMGRLVGRYTMKTGRPNKGIGRVTSSGVSDRWYRQRWKEIVFRMVISY